QEGRNTMTTMTSNGRPARKTLASQIDRLDTMLEGLSENLNEAVADAGRAAVVVAGREAGQAGVSEVPADPQGLAQRRHALPPPPVATPVATPAAGPPLKERMAQVWSWLGAKARSVLVACQGGLNRLGAAAVCQCRRVQHAARATWLRLRVLRYFRGQLLL